MSNIVQRRENVSEQISVVVEDGTRLKVRFVSMSGVFVVTVFRGKPLEINPEGEYYSENRLRGNMYEVVKREFLEVIGGVVCDKYFDYALPLNRCLSASDEVLVHYLRKFIYRSQFQLAEYLRGKGYRSKSGVGLTNSHISNFLRKDLGIRAVSVYCKPNYSGCNWLKFR